MKYFLTLLLLTFRATCASVTLEWDNEDLSESYTVVASTNGVSWLYEGITTNRFTATNLQSGVLHSFQVFGVNQFGAGPESETITISPSEPIEVVIPEIAPPSSVSIASYIVAPGSQWSIALKWPQVTNAIGYKTVVLTNGKTTEYPSTIAGIQISRLQFGVTNSISVSAVDAFGNRSEQSQPLIAIISESKPTLKTVTYTNLFQLP